MVPSIPAAPRPCLSPAAHSHSRPVQAGAGYRDDGSAAV